MNTKAFIPQVINFDVRRQKQALNAWESYLLELSSLTGEITGFLEIDEIQTDQVLSILSEKPERIIIRLHQLSGKVPENIDIETGVKQGLLINEYATDIVKDLNHYLSIKSEAEYHFKYNVSTLRTEEGLFAITDEFEKALNKACTVWTRSEAENEALNQLNTIIDGFNWFVKNGFVNTSTNTEGLSPLMRMITVSVDRVKFAPDPNGFKWSRWKKLAGIE